MTRPFFWLHIKKNAGQSIRKALAPYYVEVERRHNPLTFANAGVEQYNDILNNFRTDLGAYQFRRSLYARDYLYKERWHSMVRFAVCRDPADRALSIFFYLSNSRTMPDRIARWKYMMRHRKMTLTTSSAFDAFLDMVDETLHSEDPKTLYGQHFSTHTATAWDDITDRDGTILLNRIFRLEHLAEGLNSVLRACNLPTKPADSIPHINRSRRRDYTLTKAQRLKIERLYSKDFDLYESCTPPG